MHEEILDDNQLKVLNELKAFKKDFYLAGGTALALQIGHRKSIDFDFFQNKPININSILKKINPKEIQRTIVRSIDQFTIVYNGVNLTFLNYPFKIQAGIFLDDVFESVDILTIGAMKAYALGRLSKWKDYIDLYFILHQFTLIELTQKAQDIYGNLWNTKLFLEQLAYFNDVDYSEKVEFVNKNIEDSEIRDFLIKTASDF